MKQVKSIKIAANKLNYEMVKLLATQPEIIFDLETIYTDINHDKLKIILLWTFLKKDKEKIKIDLNLLQLKSTLSISLCIN